VVTVPDGARPEQRYDTFGEFFAAELRQYRKARDLTQDALAELIHFSPQTVSAVENGTRSPNEDFAARCDQALGTGGALSRLRGMLHKDAYPWWFRPFVNLEAEALAIQEFEVQVIAGLLQTEEYARAVLKSWPPKKPAEIERRLEARLERQQILTRDDPPLLSFVMDESVLRRPMGGCAVMAEQLRYLTEVAELPHVTLQVLPFDRAQTAPTDGSFTVMDMPNKERLVYIEGPGKGQIIPGAEEVEYYARAFGAACIQALAVEDSIAMIHGLRSELYER
jgi:transcriptional regulator with XRE-family HTH domain